MIFAYYPEIDEDVEPLHAFVMEGFERAPERLTNRDALAAALQRPRNAAYYEGADLATQAARLMAGVAAANAYPDGNKRTALGASLVFLRLNGIEPKADGDDWEQLVFAVASGALDREATTAMLRALVPES